MRIGTIVPRARLAVPPERGFQQALLQAAAQTGMNALKGLVNGYLGPNPGSRLVATLILRDVPG